MNVKYIVSEDVSPNLKFLDFEHELEKNCRETIFIRSRNLFQNKIDQIIIKNLKSRSISKERSEREIN